MAWRQSFEYVSLLNRYTLSTHAYKSTKWTWHSRGAHLRFVNQLPNLPQVQHLGSVIRGLCASPNPLFRDADRDQTLNSWKVNSFLTSRSLQEAERPTSLTGKVTTGNAAATSTCVEQHWSCSFCRLSWAAEPVFFFFETFHALFLFFAHLFIYFIKGFKGKNRSRCIVNNVHVITTGLNKEAFFDLIKKKSRQSWCISVDFNTASL